MGLAPTQAPPWQVSVRVQKAPSLQAVPLGLAGLEQAQVGGAPRPAAGQWPAAGLTTGVERTQAAPWQVSVRVQRVPSSQVVAFGLAGLGRVPVVGLQVPAAWHWSEAEQTTGFAPTQEPPWQVSVRVQRSPSSHVVASGLAGLEQA